MERDKWQKSKGKPFKPAHEPPSGVPAVKEVIAPGYEEYLLLLQQRNRLLKRLKEKDEQQIEIEKKEQGFSIYVNGANMGMGAPSTGSPKGRSTSRQAKTADTYSERKKLLLQELQFLEKEAGELRVKTAPDQTENAPRRGWNPEAVQIRTEKGPKVRVAAPGKLSGKYSEDFESLAIDHDDDDDDDYKMDYTLGVISSDDDEEDPDELTLSFNDVETLRKSLEADESIRESIEAAKMRIEEEAEKGTNFDEDEEIEEELEGANDSLNLRDSNAVEKLVQLGGFETNAEISVDEAKTSEAYDKGGSASSVAKSMEQEPIRKEKTFVKESGKKTKSKPVPAEEDVVVLSFSSGTKPKKERVLSATRRKPDAEDIVLSAKRSESPPQQDQNMSQTASSEDSSAPKEFRSSSRSKSRPLSATRKSDSTSDTKPDDNLDEVLKAMREENQEIESCRSGPRTAPEKFKAWWLYLNK